MSFITVCSIKIMCVEVGVLSFSDSSYPRDRIQVLINHEFVQQI